MNKRGFLFTGLVIVMISLFVPSYSIYSTTNERKNTQKRVETLNDLVFAIEQDLKRQLFTSAFRVIFSLQNQIVETGQFITNMEGKTQELFLNGTVNSIQQEIMLGATLSDIQSSLNTKANKINANITISRSNLTISQTDPWNIRADLEIDILIEDVSNLALWNKTEEITAFIPIEGFEDPLYFINTNGLVANQINQTPHTNFVEDTNVTNLLDHATNSYYIASPDSPSFLQRFEGDLSANSNGIESLVNLQKLSNQGVSIEAKSAVDHIYFSTNDPTKYNIQGMPSWFYLDDAHLSTYQASNITS